MEVKLLIFKTVYLPLLLYGSESWVLADRPRSRIITEEMMYLRRTSEKTRRDLIRNECIRGEAQYVFDHGENRKEAVDRPPGRRPRGRSRMKS